MDWGNYFIREDFHWLEEMFDKYEGETNTPLGCPPSTSYLYMPDNFPLNSSVHNFSISVIAAVPGSKILLDSFAMLSETIITGILPNE